MRDERQRCWAEFLEAAEASAVGDHSLALDLVRRHPVVAGELRAFVRAIVAGRLVKTPKGWRSKRVVDKPKARAVVEA